jgi:general secretion pathway protein D
MDRRDRRRLYAAALLLAPLVSASPALAAPQSDEETKRKQEQAEQSGQQQGTADEASEKEKAAAAERASARNRGPQDTVGGAKPGVPRPVQPANVNVNPNVNNPAAGRPQAGRPGAPAVAPVTQQRPGGGAGASTSGSSGPGMGELVDIGDFYVLSIDEQGEGIDLLWLTKMCQTATGKNLTPDKAVAEQLLATKVRMFGQKRIPKGEFYEFYQILMFINGFTITKVGPDHLAVFLIQSLGGQAGARTTGTLKDEAIYVMPDELDRYADQVATQIITVLHLPNYDVRTLQSTLRPLMPNDQAGSIMPVGNTQSVVLRGFAPNIVALARILRLVDQEAAKDTGVSPQFEVIPLEFAAAEDLADILEQLLEARKRESQARRQANPQGATGQIQSTGGESKILTYPRTNSLLVMALPSDMQAIKELIARLDVEVVEPERTYHVYSLEHVKAADLSEVLDDFLQSAQRVQQQGAAGRAGGGQAAAPAATGLTSRDNEVVVVPDESTNSLLIAASRRRYEEVLELIHRLDLRQDQVLIETALIELSGRDSLDLGVELGFADVPGSGTGGFGVSSFGLSTFQDTDGDGIPDIRVPALGNGITAGIIDADDFSLPILVRALRDRQDTNVLNIPSVLVNNNGSATVTTLDEQPTTQVTATGVGGQTQENFNNYQQAGITMQISPSISASGYLRLSVSLEVSSFTGTFSGPIPPPRITRSIQTSVSVPNGDTMVIGGIITDNKGEQRTSIPLLGDLPVLGALFRRDVDNQNRTTLYFFVTPHILKDKNFADLAEISYKVKLDAAEKIGSDRVRMIDPVFGAKDSAVDLRGFEVPLYRSPGGGEQSSSMVGQDPEKAAAAKAAGNP